MAPINSNKNPNIPKKQTGTVPKLSSIMMHNNSNNGLVRDLGIYSQSPSSPPSQQPLSQQQHQQQQLQPQQQKSVLVAKSTTPSNKTRPGTSYRTSTSRKNTEVVAPTRRELNDLNDYLLITSVNSDPAKQQNNNHSGGHNHITGIVDSVDTSGQQQQQQQLDTSCYDIENINFQENQRFCYPVRPIPRRSVNKKQQLSQQQNNLYGEQNLNISNTPSSSSAAVGVVIPTTPINPTITAAATSTSLLSEDNYNISGINNTSRISSSNTTYQNILCDPQQQHIANVSGSNNLINNLPIDINGDLTWEERLNFIQYFLSVTSKLSNQKGSINQFSMVNETGESKSDEIFVNSTSLEDVAQSESSDRAHSVSSVHTLSGAEPSTPNYEELQQRLESSNRNIQNIKDQQQQLLRLQQAAKQHLSDMEDVRNQTPIRFAGGGAGSGSGSNENGTVPDYESVEQVHNDMSALVNRMKNLQTFIQNQNELSSLLGEDNPELLAEQELLQRKLNELKSHRTEMRNLVDELQNINTNAEKTIQQGNENNNTENHNGVSVNVGDVGVTAPPIPSRVVPVEYQRVVPIELVGANKKPPPPIINTQQQQNGHTDTEDDNEVENDEMDPATADMINQKVADINAMKKQLQRLKDMMETVRLIEGKNEGPDAKDIGREDAQSNTSRSSSKAPIEVPASLQRDFTKNVKKAFDNHGNGQTAEEAAMSERVRLLHEMTDDLRNQAMSLTSERDRLKVLREELKRRRDFEVNEKKNSNNKENENLTTINNTLQHKGNNTKSEQDALENEYEEKKKEFRLLCERLQSEEDQNDDAATVTGNEDNEDLDDESNNQTMKQERSLYTTNWQRNANSTSCNSSINQEKNCSANVTGACVAASGIANANVVNTPNRGKDSADSAAADVHGNGVAASIEAGSIQSGSSRSYSMPPPMRSINNPVWRKNSHEHAHLHGPQPVGCEHYMTGTWNSYPMYQNPYAHIQLSCAQPTSNGEYVCSSHAWNNLGINTTSGANPTTLPNTNDPVLLQQFIQTQQMLINSVCQCNQMLWHQQREINNLNNTVVMLQERILSTTPDLQSLQGNNRSESVPPLPQNSTLYGIGMNRAQSDQLHASVTIPGPLYSTLQQQQQSLSTPISPNRQCHALQHNYNTSNNFLQQQQQHQRRHLIQNQNGATTQQSMTSATSNYNYSAEQTTSGIYGNQPPQPPQPAPGAGIAFNNAQPMNFLNNDPAHQNNHSAGPIFMHHHNNNIGGIGGQHQHAGNINNSNSNLLHQNATNSPTSTTAALNNQVPPGTRANNYWDNFRSYSRQNLLSSNSCKSNEELNHQMQLQHQQHLQQQQVQQPQSFPYSHINNSSATYNLSPISSTNNINIQNECRPLSSISAGGGPTSATNLTLNVPNSSNTNLTATINSNNLNPLNYDSKYFHTFRNEFNSNNQQQSGISTVSPGTVQPINLTSSATTITTAAINAHSTLNVEPSANLGIPQNVSTTTTAPFNNNINEIQHLEVNQGGSASSNLSVAHSDNLNENIFDFNSGINSNYNNNNININNNNNNINNSTNNATNVASIFGSPDFRNMNFNFGLHEPKKIPMKTACTASAKRLRHTQSTPNNSLNANDTGAYGDTNVGNNYSVQSNHNILNHHNNDHHRYEEMGEGAVGFDETSEEIKRNLLVNALKSDKFTSKFFESLKEDVYRQAYAIIQEKKSDPQFLIQLFEEIKGAPAYDPLRNMLAQSFHNLNLSTASQRNHHHRTNNDTESNDGDNEMENEESSSAVTAEAAVAAAVASVTNTGIQNYYKVEDTISPPQSINSQSHIKYNQQPNVSADCLYQRNSTPSLCNSDNADMKLLFLNTKDYKFPHDNSLLLSNSGIQQKNKSNDLRNERVNQQYQMRNYNEPRYSNDIPKKRPESHIINYTIFKIRKEIQKQQIDDATLLKIVKITIQTLEDAIANLQQPSPVLAASLRSLLYRIKLSTKEIFTKMKNYQNQEKDNFLSNYQSYLNKLLTEDSNNINLAKPTRHFGEAGDLGFWQTGDINQVQNKSSLVFNNQVPWNEAHNLPKQSVSYKSNISSVVGSEAKVMNSSDNQNVVNEIFLNLNQQNVHTSHRHQQNQYQQHQHDIGSPCTSSNNIMNEDLAEADQICSSNNPILIGAVDKSILENNNGRHLSNDDSNSPSIDDGCVGAVGYSNIQNPNDDNDLVLNDQDVAANENNAESEENRKYSGNDIDEDSENNIIDCCDNDKVEDDQDFNEVVSASVVLVNETDSVSQTKDTKILVTCSPSQVRPKRSKANRKSDIVLDDNATRNEFGELSLNNPEEITTDNYVSNNKSNTVKNSGSNNSNNITLGRVEGGGNNVIVTSSGSTTNNAFNYIFPMSIESDSMINNNLDSGYQSFPQPDSSSSLSNSHTESVESNGSSIELTSTKTNSGKRNSVP